MGTHLLQKYDQIIKSRKLKWSLAARLLEENENLSTQFISQNKSSVHHLLPIKLKINNPSQVDNVIETMAVKFGVQLAKQYMPLLDINYLINMHQDLEMISY